MYFKKKNITKPKTYYNFDYLEKELKQFRPEFRHVDKIEQSINMIESRIFFWFDLDPEKTGTWHNGKKIVPEHDFDKEKEEFIKYLIEKYKVEK